MSLGLSSAPAGRCIGSAGVVECDDNDAIVFLDIGIDDDQPPERSDEGRQSLQTPARSLPALGKSSRVRSERKMRSRASAGSVRVS